MCPMSMPTSVSTIRCQADFCQFKIVANILIINSNVGWLYLCKVDSDVHYVQGSNYLEAFFIAGFSMGPMGHMLHSSMAHGHGISHV